MNARHSASANSQLQSRSQPQPQPRSPQFESLEERRLFAFSVVPITPISPISPITGPISAPPVASANALLRGEVIHAEAGQAFTAVVGQILQPSVSVPTGYTLNGSIDWGDGTTDTNATFVKQANGIIDILGGHTYTDTGREAITITVTRTPPAGTAGAVVLVGQIKSVAQVIEATGQTLNETTGVQFTTGVGSFSSNLSSQNMRAIIDWGDGTSSVGKLIAEPTAGPVGRFQVVGTHTYAQTESYLVKVEVLYAPPRSTTGPTPTFVMLVANFESVIDVIPAQSVATT